MLIFVFFSIYFINYVTGYIARTIGKNLNSNNFFPTDNIANWIINGIAHILVLIVSVLILILFYKKNLREIGFNFRNKEKSFKYIKWYCIILTIVLALGTIIPVILSKNAHFSLIKSFYSSSTKDKIAEILYMFIIPGIGEEPLYRPLQ